MKKLESLKQDIFSKHKDLFLWLFVVCWIAILSIAWNTEWFRASVIKIPEKFNWTVRPVEKIPNWFTWWWDNKTTKFWDISVNNLIEMPSYNISIWWKNAGEIYQQNSEKNAKLTYAVVYLGNYQNSREEYSWSHPAVDIRIPVGTPIRSVANGKVIKVINSNVWFWNHIVIEMPSVPNYPDNSKNVTLYASYSHLDETLVSVWDIVRKWQLIWKSWNSWTSTTPHLHFQIDSKVAKWYPYWPFTSKELYAANMSFFSAISNWFKQENAIENTINPMRWVESHLDWNIEWIEQASSDQSVFDEFKIISSDQFTIDSRLALTIIAQDKQWRIITDLKSSTDIEVSSTSNNARFSKNLRFKNWIATVYITSQTEEEFEFKINYKNKTFSKNIKSLKVDVKEDSEVVAKDEQADTNENNVVIDKDKVATINNEQKINEEIEVVEKEEVKEEVKVVEKQEAKKEVIPDEAFEIDENIKILFSWETDVFVWDKLNIDIFINDLDWAFADINRDYAVDVAWVWKVNQYLLRKTDFVWSKIRIQFSSENKWNSIVSLNWVDFEIKVKEKPVVVVETPEVIEEDEEIGDESQMHASAETKEDPIEENKDLFTDVNTNHVNYQAIKFLKETWVISGYDDWSFKPNKIVSRVESVKMIFKALKIDSVKNVQLPFSDTDDNAWYSEFVWAALNKKIVKWYSDWTFKPANEVNRAEYYKILLLSAWINVDEATSDPYNDVPYNAWFGSFVNYVKANNLSDANLKFYPSNWVSRAEVAESIYRLVRLLKI